MNREEKIKDFVTAYDIEVPAAKVESELNYIKAQLRHGMQYDALTGGGLHPFPEAELAEQREELEKLAYYEVKQELVIKDIIERRQFSVTKEELESEAEAMAARQGCTVEMIRGFFGADLAMLERDVKTKKAEEWICEQI